MNKDSLTELQNSLTLVIDLQNKVKENLVSAGYIVEELNSIRIRLEAILKQERS